MVFVNTVVLVQSGFGLTERHTAWALAAFGAGSILAALVLPRLLEKALDRVVLLFGAAALVLCLALGSFVAASYSTLLALWCVLGGAYSLTLTPLGRVLRRSSHAEDRPALFAAHFALSHACWLIAYPLAGFISAGLGIDAAFLALALLCGLGAAGAMFAWPANEPDTVAHSHDDLSPDDPHFTGNEHAHVYVIDELHPRWPRRPD